MADPLPGFHPEDAIAAVADLIAVPVTAAPLRGLRLRWRNDRAAATVGLDALDDAAWCRHFGAFAPLPGAQPTPLALQYHGHQFRTYNPDIGDGRGFLFAQARDTAGRVLDFGTKGSGQTPFSRFGDGRLTLKGAVRELLATEMLDALGVPTSRTFSIIETDEALTRGDEPSPTRAAVLVRLSHGHIRIGTFQRLAYLRDTDGLARLRDYVERVYLGGRPLMAETTRRAAMLAGRYMAAGFVHGVLNTDNINVSGESFDYGPWRFAPVWDTGFTAAYFDEGGLYAFGRQAEAIYWNLLQLASSLAPISETAALTEALDGFVPAFHRGMADGMLQRLGLAGIDDAQDIALARAIATALATSRVPIADWFAHPDTNAAAFTEVAARLADYAPPAPLARQSMLIDEMEALWAPIAEADDWTPLWAKIAAIRASAA